MSWPPLDSTTFGANPNNATNWIDSCWDKNARPHATDTTKGSFNTTNRVSNTTNGFVKAKMKSTCTADQESDLSPLDSSSSKSDFSNDSNYSKPETKRRDKKKKRHKHNKQESSDSLSSDSDSSKDIEYRLKWRKKKSHRKNDPIKLCARLTAKFLTASHK